LAYILVSKLRSMNVVSDRGLQIGRVVDISFDETTGKIISLIVKPVSGEALASFPRNEDGTISLPFTAVLSVKDFIVVNEKVIGIHLMRSSPTQTAGGPPSLPSV